MNTDMSLDITDELPQTEHEPLLNEEEDVEFFECVKCSEWNIIKNKPNDRRTKRARHIRMDDVVYGSLKRYASINNVGINKAIMLLLFNARTNNINYVISERQFVNKNKSKPLSKGKR